MLSSQRVKYGSGGQSFNEIPAVADGASTTLYGTWFDTLSDPLFFAELCRAIQQHRADMALGNRLIAGNAMPRLRRL